MWDNSTFISSKGYKTLFLVIIAILILSSCHQEADTVVYSNHKTLIFGHRGSGSGVYQGKYIENTLSSVRHALEKLDGTEVDVQMSADGTIWVFHDEELTFLCDTNNFRPPCLPLSSDDYLNTIRICREGVEDRLYQLEEVFQLLALPEFSDKYLSVDVKGYFKASCFENRNAPSEYHLHMAEACNGLINKYQLKHRVFFETDYKTFHDKIKQLDKEVQCHLLSYSDFLKTKNRVIEKGYDGISFNLKDETATQENISQAMKQGIAVQLWTVYTRNDLEKAMKLNPFSIQVSQVGLVEDANSN
jgi:glycerophosphoryl diester phosphodiesterase